MAFDLQPVEEFGWPTCAGRAEEVDHGQRFRPPQNKEKYDLILSDSSLTCWCWWLSSEVAPTSPDIAPIRLFL